MELEQFSNEIDKLQLGEQLIYLANQFPDRVVFSTSFSLEDQIITHLIFANEIPIKVFTLDTGRLFPETYYVWSRTLERYNQPIASYFPETERIQTLVKTSGPNGFYNSVEDRKACCYVRKIEPLKRALKGKAVWITGIRAEQSINREGMQSLEWDKANQLVKFHPLFRWNLNQVKSYISKNNIIYNTLHDKGYPSIGCAPCTRAIKEGEDFRKGRWWWEDQTKKECGLHEL